MRTFAACVALIAVGCAMNWQSTDTNEIKHSSEWPDRLFVMTDDKAYELQSMRLEGNVIHGRPTRIWLRGPNSSFAPRPNDSPERLAERSHWTPAATVDGEIAIPISDIRYSAAGDQPSVIRPLLIIGLVAVVVVLVGGMIGAGSGP